MRRFIIFILLLILSIWAGLKIAQDPGMAYFSYQHWSVEMPLWFAVIATITLLYLVYLLASFFDSIQFAIYRVKNWFRLRREHKAANKTHQGLLELIEGNWSVAESYLLRGISQSEMPLINYLGAAKAAHEQGNFNERDNFLEKAHVLSPNSSVVIGLVKANLQLKHGQTEQALMTLQHLRQRAPKHKAVLKLLERLYTNLGEWRELLKLLPYLRKAKLIAPGQELAFEAHIYREIFYSPESQHDGYLGLQHMWDCIPSKVRANPELVVAYAKRLMAYPEARPELEVLINKNLKKYWNEELTTMYGLLQTNDTKKQLSHAEGWQKSYANQPVLFLTLGRLSMACLLWGKARTYFEMSLKLGPLAETYLAYGTLLEQLGEQEAALKQYRLGLVQRIL